MRPGSPIVAASKSCVSFLDSLRVITPLADAFYSNDIVAATTEPIKVTVAKTATIEIKLFFITKLGKSPLYKILKMNIKGLLNIFDYT